MWYPNRNQWRVIWTIAGLFTLIALAQAIDNFGVGGLLLMVLIDGALLVWKLQHSN